MKKLSVITYILAAAFFSFPAEADELKSILKELDSYIH